VMISVVIFWVVMLCGLVGGYQHFILKLFYQNVGMRLHGIISQKTNTDNSVLHSILRHFTHSGSGSVGT
jgi:choline-glycine betaine transporter